MKTKIALFFIISILCLFSASASAQSTFMIYYQAGDSIYGITDLSDKPTLIASKIPETVTFSNSGRYAAYHDNQGVWISRTDSWSPERVISTLPDESFGLMWTPDDTRLILRLAFWPKDFDPTKQPLAYNLLTKSTEPWIWSECNQIGQDVSSKDFALICHAKADMPSEPIDAVALSWGGDFSAYNSDQYTILLGGLVDHFPTPFNWGITGNEQNLVYSMENPNYQINSDKYSAVELISQWSDGSESAIDRPQEPAIEQWFAVSPDRTMIAYTVFCGKPNGICLQIADLRTGAIKWSYQQTIQVDQVYDIVWYPDNHAVAVLGANADVNSNYLDAIYVFDVETGTSTQVNVGNTSGVITIPS